MKFDKTNFLTDFQLKTSTPATMRKFWDESKWIRQITSGSVLLPNYPDVVSNTTITGFQKADNLLSCFKDCKAFCVTLTCSDINKITIDRCLKRLKSKKVGQLLIVTGDNYQPPVAKSNIFFRDSREIIIYITKKFPGIFRIGIAAYPTDVNIEREFIRLKHKLTNDVSTVYCQFAEDPVLLKTFVRSIRQDIVFKDLEIVVTVPICAQLESYLKAVSLCKIPTTGTIYGYHTSIDAITYKAIVLDKIVDFLVNFKRRKVVLQCHSDYDFVFEVIDNYKRRCRVVQLLKHDRPAMIQLMPDGQDLYVIDD